MVVLEYFTRACAGEGTKVLRFFVVPISLMISVFSSVMAQATATSTTIQALGLTIQLPVSFPGEGQVVVGEGPQTGQKWPVWARSPGNWIVLFGMRGKCKIIARAGVVSITVRNDELDDAKHDAYLAANWCMRQMGADRFNRAGMRRAMAGRVAVPCGTSYHFSLEQLGLAQAVFQPTPEVVSTEQTVPVRGVGLLAVMLIGLLVLVKLVWELCRDERWFRWYVRCLPTEKRLAVLLNRPDRMVCIRPRESSRRQLDRQVRELLDEYILGPYSVELDICAIYGEHQRWQNSGGLGGLLDVTVRLSVPDVGLQDVVREKLRERVFLVDDDHLTCRVGRVYLAPAVVIESAEQALILASAPA